MKITLITFVLLSSFSAFAQTNPPPADIRAKILTAVASEMERLDGEALYVRQNRVSTWTQIKNGLEQEAANAKSWLGFMRSLLRLDLSYPNLHSSAKPGQDAMKYLPKRAKPKVAFQAEWLASNKVKYVISKVDSDIQYNTNDVPQVGDEVLAINGRDVQDWKNENFEFCKFPIKEQCDVMLPSMFEKELLSWTREQPLSYKVQRAGRVWTIAIAVKEEGTYLPSPKGYSCRQEMGRYDDFKMVYAGNRACIYESIKHPGTAIFRIMGFNYSKDSLEQNEQIDSLSKEIDVLYPWWIQHATWTHLIFDIIDNHGGNGPIGYYQILFQHEFQEQFVTFKKTPEMDTSSLRQSVFWGSTGQEIWFQNLVSSGVWASLQNGEYTQPVPMFCVDENQDCSVGLFPVRPHPFNGRISVLLNQWCVSSCDGFAYNLKEKFGSRAKFYGHPQAADTAYSRLTINVHLDSNLKDGFRLEVVPLYDSSSKSAFMSQTIVVTRSVTHDGTIVSGKPVPIDEFVPLTRQNSDSWPNEVLKHAL